MKKLILCVVLSLVMTFPFVAQSHTSVPIDDPVYFLLDNAAIKGYCNLPSVRPYSLDNTLRILDQILSNPDLSDSEREIYQTVQDRLRPSTEKEWYKTGRFNFNYDTKGGIRNRIGLGASASVHIGSNFMTPSFSYEAILNGWIHGDFTDFFSYKLLMGAGLSDYAFDAYAPYTLYQPYDGFQFLLNPMGDFTAKTDQAHIGLIILPEISFGFGDGMLQVNFSRVKRDWQVGEGVGGLLIAGSSRPFMAVDLHFQPVNWFQLSFLTGVLEYNKADTGTIRPLDFQNSFSATKMQFSLGKYIDAAVNAAVVFPKRFELGYMSPLMISLFYQNMVGDFDNMYLGGTLVVKIPRWGRLFFDVLLSEIRSFDIFYTPQNVYAWQAGAQGVIPGLPITLTLQYTKIEPFMYTHYGTITPWTGDTEMNTSLLNHGEGIGSNLPPNTDELKIMAKAMPFWFLECEASYRMVRHGITPLGSTYTPTDYSDMPDKKHFLHDGVYQWQHIFMVGADYNMEGLGVPMKLFCDLGLVYSYYTDIAENPTTKEAETYKINTSQYPVKTNVIATIGFKLYP